MMKAAILSPCETYRYSLTRVWDKDLPVLGFVMLNPSTADGEKDDPTIRKCIGFARRLGYGSIIVTNLFAFRATSPKTLKSAGYPVGPDNNFWIRAMENSADNVICAWGANARGLDRAKEITKGLGNPMALKLAEDGTPHHPLMLPYTSKLQLLRQP